MNGTYLIEIAIMSLRLFGKFGIILLPILMIGVLIFTQIRVRRLDVSIVALLLMILPATSPFFATVLGYDHYTYLNWELQDDSTLVAGAILLICFFSISFFVGAFFIPNKIIKYSLSQNKIKFSKSIIVFVFIINFILIILFLEAGNVLTSAYGEFKKEGSAPYSSLVNQIFNLSVAICLAYVGKLDRRRLILFIYIIFIVLALILSRRTLALGLMMLAGFALQRYQFSIKQGALLVIGVSLLWFIGEARKVGVLNYLSGERALSVNDFVLGLPGGASNIFVSVLGVVDAFDRGLIRGWEGFPIVFWLFDINELTIYGSLSYAYNGGMHLASVFYWNFGILGVFSGGFLLGVISQRIQSIMNSRDDLAEGSLKRMLCHGFIIVMPNLIWYHPTALIKLTLAICVSFLALKMLKKIGRSRRGAVRWSR